MALQSRLFRGDEKLEAAAVSDPAHVVRGARGPHVAEIQQALIRLDGAALDPDGDYGPATAAAVAAFKAARKILNFQGKIDDIVGKKTIAALDAELLAAEPQATGRPEGRRGIAAGLDGLGGVVNPLGKVHLLFFFSGDKDDPKDGSKGGFLLSPPKREAEDFVPVMDAAPVPNSGDLKTVLVFAGSGTTKDGARLAASVVRGMAGPFLGRVIVYGFSAGAINGLDLCRELVGSPVTVDLLITVDPVNGDRGVNTTVPGNVLLTRNYFQKRPLFPVGLEGVRLFGSARVDNVPCNDLPFYRDPRRSRHSEMPGLTVPRAKKDLLEALA